MHCHTGGDAGCATRERTFSNNQCKYSGLKDSKTAEQKRSHHGGGIHVESRRLGSALYRTWLDLRAEPFC